MSKYWMVTNDKDTSRLFYLRSEAEGYLIEILKTSAYAHNKYSKYVSDALAGGNDTEGFYDYLALIVKAHKDETYYELCWNYVQEIPVCTSIEQALEEDKAKTDEIKDLDD